jgi:hypothetical protein
MNGLKRSVVSAGLVAFALGATGCPEFLQDLVSATVEVRLDDGNPDTATGALVEGADVSLDGEIVGTTDAEGRLDITGVEPGDHEVHVDAGSNGVATVQVDISTDGIVIVVEVSP